MYDEDSDSEQDVVLSSDYKKRDELLGIHVDWNTGSIGGTERFKDVPLKALRMLVDLNLADPEDAQNDAPTLREFIKFMEKYPQCMAHGYAVSPNRDDYRVTIEGLSCRKECVTEELKDDFIEMFRCADEFSIKDGLRCWYD